MEFNQSVSEIEEKLALLKTQGYDRIHIPGGTSKDGTHYSGVIIPAYDPSLRKMYFVGVPYDSNFHKSGDDNNTNKKLGEHAIETAIREVIEETGLSVLPEDLEKLDASYSITDNRDVTKKHYKNYYLATKVTGNLFAFSGPNPIDGETAAPVLIPVELFVKVIFGGHKKALESAIQKLLSLNGDYAFALMNYDKMSF